MIEAYCATIFMIFTALLLLAMTVGFSPIDNWHTNLVLAGIGLSLGSIIAMWLRSEGFFK